MTDKTDFYAKIRWNITFIAEEIEKIPTSPKTKEQILKICNTISSEILHKIGETPDEKLMTDLSTQLARFDQLIQGLENAPTEQPAYMLLITHVADMFALIAQAKQK